MNQSCSCWPTSQPQQLGIQASSATYTTAHGKHRILNPQSEARNRTCILMDTSRIINPLSHNEDSLIFNFYLDYFFYFLFFCFLGLHPWHMKVPKLGVKLELQLLAYITATATRDPSHICYLHHSSWQHQILNPLREARIKSSSSWILVRFITC